MEDESHLLVGKILFFEAVLCLTLVAGTFVVYLIANICLAFSNNFALLMVFRGMQATGSAATISIGQGVIADIASPKERGSFTGTNQGSKFCLVLIYVRSNTSLTL